MKLEVYKTNNFYVAVSNEEIKTGDYKLQFYETGKPADIRKVGVVNGDKIYDFDSGVYNSRSSVKKVIATDHSTKIEGLFNFKLPENKMYKAIELAEQYVLNHPDYPQEGLSDYQNGLFNGFIEGFLKSSTIHDPYREICDKLINTLDALDCSFSESNPLIEKMKVILNEFRQKGYQTKETTGSKELSAIEVEYTCMNIDEIRENGKGFLYTDTRKLKIVDGFLMVNKYYYEH